MWELDYKESWALKSWCFWTVVLEKTLERPLDLKRSNHSILKRSVLGVHWKDWCWNWNSNTLATWCEELTHLKRPWCWERLRAGGEGDYRGWDGWMASLTQWTWVSVSSGSGWWTERPGVLKSTGMQRVRHNWVTELNWTEFSAHNSQMAQISLPWPLRIHMATAPATLLIASPNFITLLILIQPYQPNGVSRTFSYLYTNFLLVWKVFPT